MKEEDGKITMTPLPNEERAIRSMSFGLVAEEYDRYRPKLPEAALDWLLPPECQTALDLGAGTGAATRVLARRVPHVISVEPDPRMRAVIAGDTPQAQVLEGRAEAIPLKDGSVDVVLVCSAWHWMDPDLAVPEIARVLRPAGCGGSCGTVSTVRCRGWQSYAIGSDIPIQTRSAWTRIDRRMCCCPKALHS